MNSIETEAIDNLPIGTSCQICDSFILLVGVRDAYYPRICVECKRRLKELLYEPPKEE